MCHRVRRLRSAQKKKRFSICAKDSAYVPSGSPAAQRKKKTGEKIKNENNKAERKKNKRKILRLY
jgi:hypothetical protein